MIQYLSADRLSYKTTNMGRKHKNASKPVQKKAAVVEEYREMDPPEVIIADGLHFQ